MCLTSAGRMITNHLFYQVAIQTASSSVLNKGYLRHLMANIGWLIWWLTVKKCCILTVDDYFWQLKGWRLLPLRPSNNSLVFTTCICCLLENYNWFSSDSPFKSRSSHHNPKLQNLTNSVFKYYQIKRSKINYYYSCIQWLFKNQST